MEGLMKIIQYILGILTAFCLMIILLITSVEAVTYWTPGFYEKEYAKYGVTEDVHMEMEDLLDVTHEMMLFLRGDRDDLHVMTTVNGQQREFFNEREIAHMEDVKGLFVGALILRRICMITALISLLIMFLLKGRAKTILPKTLCMGTGLFFAVLLLLAGIISTDFSRYFIIFHQIFFDNDLWILDPATDLLINIVPEPFFMDTAARIGITYGISVLVLFAVCLFVILRDRKKEQA